MKFGELLKTKRKEMDGVSQEVLAEKLGVSKQTISNWESGRNMPLINDSVVDLMPSVLNVSKSEILSSLMENVGKCENLQKEERTINYPFLPSGLMNLKLSKEEVEILFAKEYETSCNDSSIRGNIYGNMYERGQYNFTHSLECSFTNNGLRFNDYARILRSVKDALYIRTKLNKALNFIDVKTLANIIRKNNLETFDIQQLPEDDVYEILKSRKDKDAFDVLEKNINGEFKKHMKKDGSLNTKDGLNIEYPYVSDILNECFVQVECVSEEDMLVYNTKLEIYNEEMGSWNRKMVEIQKLQDLYGSDQYPDLPEPEAPKLPRKQLRYVLSYKGLSLKEFFQKMEKLESNAPKFAKNARVELAPYLDKEASLFGTLASKENNGYLFKSLYIAESGEMFDHLWAYDIKDRLDIGKTYNIKGTVYIYEKEEGGNLVKNYGVKVSEVSQP